MYLVLVNSHVYRPSTVSVHSVYSRMFGLEEHHSSFVSRLTYAPRAVGSGHSLVRRFNKRESQKKKMKRNMRILI